MKQLLVDPPDGYLYGFPKWINDWNTEFQLYRSLIKNGYPIHKIRKYYNVFFVRVLGEKRLKNVTKKSK